MWGVFYRSFIGFSELNIVLAWQVFTLGFRLFFNLLQINYIGKFGLCAMSLCIGLASAILGFSWRCSWSFIVVTPYLSLCIYHLPKWHMMSTYVWTSSAFIFMIVWVWLFNPLTFSLFYSDENKHTRNRKNNKQLEPPVGTCTWITRTDRLYKNLFDFCSNTFTVKHRFCLMSCQRNRTSFDSFDLRVSQIWRVLSVW